MSKIGKTVKNDTWTLIQSFKEAGAYTFDVDFDGELGVYMIGGGGSGCSYYTTSGGNFHASGGASGYGKNMILNVLKGDTINIVVGAGGERVVDRSNGLPGGTTSVNGNTVSGGNGGRSSLSYDKPVSGGQGPGIDTNSGGAIKYGSRIWIGALIGSANWAAQGYIGTAQLPSESQNQFDKTMVSLCAGGNAMYSNNPGSTRIATLILPMPDGTKGGNGYTTEKSGIIDGADATGNGNGGGGVVTSNMGTYSGKGSDGAVYLYRRGFSE